MPVVPACEPLDHAAIRAAFPALGECVYLNTGTYGPMPEPALAALLEATAALERYGVACPSDLGAAMTRCREAVARMLGAEADGIAFTRNATDGINLVLAGLEWEPGDEVITTDEEHEAALHPLLYLQAARGICVRRAPVSPDGDEMVARLEAAASPRTRLVVASHVTCETGTRLPITEVCAWAAGRGALSLVDGAQSLGLVPVDVGALGCDFFSGNGHKWLHGPTGTGFLWARPERLRRLTPAHVGAGSLERADPEAPAAELWTTGQRFEFGSRTWSLFPGLLASIAWLEDLGWDRVERHAAELSGYLKDRLAERPHVRVHTPRDWQQSSGLTSFSVVGRDAGEVVRHLVSSARIYTRHVPHYDAVRISTAHFTDRDDMDRLLGALDALDAGPQG